MFWYFCFLQHSSAQKFWARTIDGLTMLQFQTVLWAWDQTESCMGAVPQPFSSSLLLKRFHRHSYQQCVLRFWGHSYQYCALKPQESWAVCFFLRLPPPHSCLKTLQQQQLYRITMEDSLFFLFSLVYNVGEHPFFFPFRSWKIVHTSCFWQWKRF